MIETVNGEYSMLSSYQIDKNSISLVDIVSLDEKTYGRMDIIASVYYGSVDYLPLLLDWNNITDVSEMQIGDVIEIPDLEELLKSVNETNNLLLQDFQDDQNYPVPGIIDNEQTYVENTGMDKETSGNIALGLTQQDTTVDEKNGFIIYH